MIKSSYRINLYGQYPNKFIWSSKKIETNMKTYIEKAEKKAGTQIELAKILNVSDAYIRNAKKGRSGLPDAICIKLADYIGVDRLEVIAASNLVTEKDEERRKIFESCLEKTKHAATATIAAFVISILTLAPISPTHAEFKTNLSNNINYTQCYIGNLKN